MDVTSTVAKVFWDLMEKQLRMRFKMVAVGLYHSIAREGKFF